MSTAILAFLFFRVAHVLLAAVWLGATVFATIVLMPALEDTGPAAGPVFAALMRRKIHVFMASLGGTTALTGVYLYWRLTGGFDPAISGTRAAMVFGAGGIAGIVAVIVGAAVVGRNAQKVADLGARLGSIPEGPARTSAAADMAAARRRAAIAGRIVIALQTIALACMAVGHYV